MHPLDDPNSAWYSASWMRAILQFALSVGVGLLGYFKSQSLPYAGELVMLLGFGAALAVLLRAILKDPEVLFSQKLHKWREEAKSSDLQKNLEKYYTRNLYDEADKERKFRITIFLPHDDNRTLHQVARHSYNGEGPSDTVIRAGTGIVGRVFTQPHDEGLTQYSTDPSTHIVEGDFVTALREVGVEQSEAANHTGKDRTCFWAMLLLNGEAERLAVIAIDCAGEAKDLDKLLHSTEEKRQVLEQHYIVPLVYQLVFLRSLKVT